MQRNLTLRRECIQKCKVKCTEFKPKSIHKLFINCETFKEVIDQL